ncbi:SUMF1/EgtB/PvdO family nonheme iron enzyme [Phormidium tenue FACHB-886]|nr:SUMF1/EgtB/PvdO family nonheme iron enzyme [Phormidium tenue FACHB-886]
MSQEIRDDAARHFAQGFYRALGYGKPIEVSYKWGCNAIQLMLSSGTATRSGTAAEERKLIVAETEAVQRVIIPEDRKPILRIRLNQAIAEQSIVVQRETEAKPTVQELQDLSRALEQEDALTQYRNYIRGFLDDRKLSAFEKIRLDRLRRDLRLTEAEANQILAEEQALIQQQIERAQDQYEEMLIRLIDEGQYPFDAATKEELEGFRQELELTDEQVEAISQRIFAAAEEEYQEQRKPKLKTFEFQTSLINVSSSSTGSKINISYRQKRAEYFVENLGNGVTLELVTIPGGTFTMGSSVAELKRAESEGPQYKVTIKPFYMGKSAVTQAQWRSVASLPKINHDLDSDPSYFKGENRPVEHISWHEAVEFCARLSHKTDKQYRLPSEAEWEYACRAGTITPFHFGGTISTVLANYNGKYTYGSDMKGNYQEQTTEVGNFLPNPFGLYDMHGNVWEWCADHWHENYQGAPIDGNAWITDGDSDKRLIRGGSWFNPPRNCRSAYRKSYDPSSQNYNIGFRVVCDLV